MEWLDKAIDFATRRPIVTGVGLLVAGGVVLAAKEILFPTHVFADDGKHVRWADEEIDGSLKEVVNAVRSAGLEGRFKRKKVLELFDSFSAAATADESGRMVLTEANFSAMFRRHLGVTNDAVIAKCFATFDVDGSGAVEFGELLAAMAFATDGSEKEKLELMFKSVDLDDDGQISQEEMVAFLENMFKIIGVKRTAIDTATHVKQLFSTFDKDRDGYITEDEFKTMGRKHNFLLGEDIVAQFSQMLTKSATTVAIARKRTDA